jgi:hypothetical protein
MKLIEICKKIYCAVCGSDEISLQDQNDKDYFYCYKCARSENIADNSNESLTNEERNK